ncbi:hypothetical protein CC80DRAFT_544562 [Byssothecium circinans]|uniref:BTB domain-containing protein n=1 Tax=Byssothecium circinans TaxID=147558 RepID=A0A6A5U7Z7_9PLEO|nr:hypothetical protein CC80DRAFT_544562 [Byssothecium circinans]
MPSSSHSFVGRLTLLGLHYGLYLTPLAYRLPDITDDTSDIRAIYRRTDGRVGVGVGPEGVEYRVKKNFLTSYSDYCRKVLSEPWKEDGEMILRLPNIKIPTFELFIQWGYFQ